MSEMSFARHLLRGDPTEKARLKRAANEACFGFQIATNNIGEGVRAGALAAEAGASWVDLNCGCPIYGVPTSATSSSTLSKLFLIWNRLPTVLAPCFWSAEHNHHRDELCMCGHSISTQSHDGKHFVCTCTQPNCMHATVMGNDRGCHHLLLAEATKRGLGSALLRNPRKLARLVAGIAEGIDLPLTVKVRTGTSASKINVQQVVSLLQDAGAAAVIVHGRTAEQRCAPQQTPTSHSSRLRPHLQRLFRQLPPLSNQLHVCQCAEYPESTSKGAGVEKLPPHFLHKEAMVHFSYSCTAVLLRAAVLMAKTCGRLCEGFTMACR